MILFNHSCVVCILKIIFDSRDWTHRHSILFTTNPPQSPSHPLNPNHCNHRKALNSLEPQNGQIFLVFRHPLRPVPVKTLITKMGRSAWVPRLQVRRDGAKSQVLLRDVLSHASISGLRGFELTARIRSLSMFSAEGYVVRV